MSGRGLDDVVRMTENLRRYETGRCAVLATRHAPYVMSIYGYTLHDVAFVRLDFRDADHATMLAGFKCGDRTMHPLLLDSPYEPGAKRCVRCAGIEARDG